MSMSVRIGDLVIINDCDAPSARMIAVVESIDTNGLYRCRYLSKYPNMKKPYGKNPTLVSTFGVKVEFGNQHYSATHIAVSVAKYRDGARRQWQPGGSPIQRFRKKAADIYFKAQGETVENA